MRVICVQNFGDRKVGDIVIVPDGAEVALGWFRPLTDAENAKLDADEAPPAETKKGKG